MRWPRSAPRPPRGLVAGLLALLAARSAAEAGSGRGRGPSPPCWTPPRSSHLGEALAAADELEGPGPSPAVSLLQTRGAWRPKAVAVHLAEASSRRGPADAGGNETELLAAACEGAVLAVLARAQPLGLRVAKLQGELSRIFGELQEVLPSSAGGLREAEAAVLGILRREADLGPAAGAAAGAPPQPQARDAFAPSSLGYSGNGTVHIRVSTPQVSGEGGSQPRGAWESEWTDQPESPYLAAHIRGPLHVSVNVFRPEHGPAPGSLDFWVIVMSAVLLVCFAGLMSGLSIGLLSLSRVDLEVIARSADDKQAAMARTLKVVLDDQHLLLVTLLLCNAVAMEGLPVLLDDLMSPVAAVVLSATAVLIFGEVLPQAVCKTFGLRVGAATAPLVQLLMTLCWPVAFPIAQVLDALIGQETGALYRRNEMVSLVNIEREHGLLSKSEALVIEGAIELAKKRAGGCIRPLDKVDSLPMDAVLDEATMDWMMSTGRSRIPVHTVGDPGALLGVILLKRLVKLRPEDATPVARLPLSPLVHVSEDTLLYDLLEIFESGHSHLAAVYNRHVELGGLTTRPLGASALGILTLEDVIEELIKTQIADETDASPTSPEAPRIAGGPAVEAAATPAETGRGRACARTGLLDVLRMPAGHTLANGAAARTSGKATPVDGRPRSRSL